MSGRSVRGDELKKVLKELAEIQRLLDGFEKSLPRNAVLGTDDEVRLDFCRTRQLEEGRSALLLGKAKDNNAASALGPFIRMFDDKFTIDDVRKAVVELEIVGADNYRLEGRSTMTEISRDPLELVRQSISESRAPTPAEGRVERMVTGWM